MQRFRKARSHNMMYAWLVFFSSIVVEVNPHTYMIPVYCIDFSTLCASGINIPGILVCNG